MPLIPERNVSVPEPTARLPLRFKLPVPVTTLFAACNAMEPVVPALITLVAAVVISRSAKMVMAEAELVESVKPEFNMKSRCGEMVMVLLPGKLIATVTSW